ncbi:MAG: HAD family hydrolase [Promethearchaeota archaeon]
MSCQFTKGIKIICNVRSYTFKSLSHKISWRGNLIDFSQITTLLFDIDHTLLIFDDREFFHIYANLIHNFFKKEVPEFEKFLEFFLASTNEMTKIENSNYDNLTKFAIDFNSRTKISITEIIERFKQFYETDWKQVCQIMILPKTAKDLLTLAAEHFSLVAATNPLFPAIANEKRFRMAGLSAFPWLEITSADDYHFAKPHLEFYEELLDRINKKPSECMMIGDDPINDMIAGKLGMKTFLIKSDGRAFTEIIQTDPVFENMNLAADHIGTLENLLDSLMQYFDSIL